MSDVKFPMPVLLSDASFWNAVALGFRDAAEEFEGLRMCVSDDGFSTSSIRVDEAEQELSDSEEMLFDLRLAKPDAAQTFVSVKMREEGIKTILHEEKVQRIKSMFLTKEDASKYLVGIRQKSKAYATMGITNHLNNEKDSK